MEHRSAEPSSSIYSLSIYVEENNSDISCSFEFLMNLYDRFRKSTHTLKKIEDIIAYHMQCIIIIKAK